MERHFSPRDVAKAIGVSESSLKRWADEGLLQVSRTAGGHRRIALREVLRYIRETGMPLIRPELVGLPLMFQGSPRRSLSLQERDAFLVDSVIRGDLLSIRGALLSRYLAGEDLASVCDGPLRVALERVGELWCESPEGIHIEHRATEACVHGLNYLRGFLPGPASPGLLALGGGVSGDSSQIPSLMAAMVLAAEGWTDLNLGANVPFAAFDGAIQEFRPRLVWIAFNHQEATEARMSALARTAKLAEELGASVVIGGRAVQSARFGSMPVHLLSSMQALAGFACGIAAARRSDPKISSILRVR